MINHTKCTNYRCVTDWLPQCCEQDCCGIQTELPESWCVRKCGIACNILFIWVCLGHYSNIVNLIALSRLKLPNPSIFQNSIWYIFFYFSTIELKKNKTIKNNLQLNFYVKASLIIYLATWGQKSLHDNVNYLSGIFTSGMQPAAGMNCNTAYTNQKHSFWGTEDLLANIFLIIFVIVFVIKKKHDGNIVKPK